MNEEMMITVIPIYIIKHTLEHHLPNQKKNQGEKYHSPFLVLIIRT